VFKIAKWYNNFRTPVVLMIDDLSDAYINVYEESYKNDWGYLCDKKGSFFYFLRKNLLVKFPDIKITFFTPYLRHAVINENSDFDYKKFAVGERIEFTNFLRFLAKEGHEIAHHGSNHGKYIDPSKSTTINNWIHEWALFDNINLGIKATKKGIKIFKEYCNIDILGGKYCGYITRENSQKIIDECNFLYWCDKPSYNIGDYNESIFGKNDIISFPTNFAGNAFIRLTYLSGDKQRDKKKKIFKYLQPIYNIYSYFNLYKLYLRQQIISIQEHSSPSTTAGIVQSGNIVTDIESLLKIFTFLKYLSIWYASCSEIAKYIYVRENSILHLEKNNLVIIFNNNKKLHNTYLTIINSHPFEIIENNGRILKSTYRNKKYTINLFVQNGVNKFHFKAL